MKPWPRSTYADRGRGAPVPAPLDRLDVLAVLVGIPEGELVRVWNLSAADGAPSALVWERMQAGLRGDVGRHDDAAPETRIY